MSKDIFATSCQILVNFKLTTSKVTVFLFVVVHSYYRKSRLYDTIY